MTASVKRAGRRRRSAVPLYHQLYLVLRQQLIEGRYGAGQALPGEEQLRRNFGVSRVTIRKTLEALESDGLVVRRRGSGTYPTRRARAAEPRANISGLFENLITVGLRSDARLLHFGMETTPPFLPLGENEFGDRTLKVIRVRKISGRPFAYMVSYLPERLGRTIRKRKLGNQPLLLILEKAGVRPMTADETLTATSASDAIARALDVALGAPLIHMTRVSRDEAGRLIEYFESYYRPDKYEYRLSLSRGRSQQAPRWVPVGR